MKYLSNKKGIKKVCLLWDLNSRPLDYIPVPSPSELLKQTSKLAFLSGFVHKSEIREGRGVKMTGVLREGGAVCPFIFYLYV